MRLVARVRPARAPAFRIICPMTPATIAHFIVNTSRAGVKPCPQTSCLADAWQAHIRRRRRRNVAGGRARSRGDRAFISRQDAKDGRRHEAGGWRRSGRIAGSVHAKAQRADVHHRGDPARLRLGNDLFLSFTPIRIPALLRPHRVLGFAPSAVLASSRILARVLPHPPLPGRRCKSLCHWCL